MSEGHYVVVYQDSAGEWRWHRKALNGEIVATSGEGYKNREHAVFMAGAVNRDIEVKLDADDA